MYIKSRFTVILSLLLAFVLAAPAYAAMTSEEKDEKYRAYVLELETYLESKGETGVPTLIAAGFAELGGYSHSEGFGNYALVLAKIASGEFDRELERKLDLLEYNQRFQDHLDALMKSSSSPFGSVAYLRSYTMGRKAEHEGRMEEAMALYRECIGFFDAGNRYEALTERADAKRYEEAVALYDDGDLAGAYYAFASLGNYLDSASMVNMIVIKLGYTPANAADNPEAVIELRVTGRDTDRITLFWNSAAHADRYEVAYRRSGTQEWTVSETTGENLATVTGLETDMSYDFRVTAMAGDIRTEKVLADQRTAQPTPTPLALQAPDGLKAQKMGPTGFMLTWNSVPHAQGYRVMVKEQGSPDWREVNNTTGTTAQISQLRGGTEYQFKVVAENGSARSESAAITARTAEVTAAPTKQPIRVGGYVTFGRYEQDNNTGNGKEPIEWLVLEEKGNKALLISRYALDCKPYNTNGTGVTWETCSLRKWLNETFLTEAFTTRERAVIVMTTADNSASQGYGGYKTSGGGNTQDRVFLLSYAEAWMYFRTDRERQCQPTKYAETQGAYKNGSSGNCWWWLRSPGSSLWSSCSVHDDGTRGDHSVNFVIDAIRPALWVEIGTDFF